MAWSLEHGRPDPLEERAMKPLAAAVAGALISGVAMFVVGSRTAPVDAFTTPTSAQVQSAPASAPVPVAAANAFQPALAPAGIQQVAYREPAPRRVVYQQPSRSSDRIIEREPVQQKRTWVKTAMIIGGTAAGGAGVGAIAGGKKGAAIGAAIGGGAASIYEAIRRH